MNKKEEEEVLNTYTEVDEDENNTETAEYSPKSEFSKPVIIAEAVRNCLSLRAKEMRAGYFNTVLANDGSPIKTWIEDERKKFIGSVVALKNALAPELKEDDEFKDLDREIAEAEQEIFKKYCYYPKIKAHQNKNDLRSKVIWVRTNEAPYIPEANAPILIDHPKYPNSTQMDYQKGYWDKNVNLYWDEMVKLYDEVFKELNLLIHSKNYFKQQIRF